MEEMKPGTKQDWRRPEKAVLIGELKPVHPQPLERRSGCETWSTEFSPDGSYFAWSLGHGMVKLVLWPLEESSGSPTRSATWCKNYLSNAGQKENDNPKEKTLDCGQTVWSLAFGPRSSKDRTRHRRDCHPASFCDLFSSLVLATGLNDGHIKVWEVLTGHLLFNLTGHQDVVRELTFAPNGGLTLVSGSRDQTLRIWDLTKGGKTAHVLTGHKQWVYCCRVSPDCSMIASVSGEKCVFLWSMRSYIFIRKLEGHKNCVISCDFSPDGAVLVTASLDTQVYLWDPYTGESLMQLSHCFPDLYSSAVCDVRLRSVRFSPEGLYFATVADDRDLRIWALGMDRPVIESPAPHNPVTNGLCCAFSPQGGVLATGTRDGQVQFWRTLRVVPSLRHLSRVSLRQSVSSHQVMALPIPKKMKDFLTYRTLLTCHENISLHHLQEVIALN
ncbi:WD repeat and SOCS box-containing protein 2-like [Acipenser oxyrinchus oxyrinchus]|uniref:WD repeat and SOCS box-containing protein 2-like n=1 Tax=Acipenser oxyrinchus oxyrinchus TaxID=40147 RepID=A0AAD8CXY3_ACIOX|nr:WD repeat and SOCS box-containing protein 2-like [Acipenser oxyrinchus oxyrinchus]